MRRILVIGCSGAGKSTLARRMGERLGPKTLHAGPAPAVVPRTPGRPTLPEAA